ncbi:MBL fold metallo-hydrolase [Aliikangiella coralliicola]|uniref:MBL fold metallo-hydrolase n=1 Tax=Aliikangiella coralliicola TaxID=2592383 RepID=A0A545U7S7_9GAMM|nr:MBL fold metallo-hydrolase [Aliikangiella coralliicola]TQV85463.1 MBL fold metallo-hydrolase [Aliikangiella coralliicola]
MNIILRSIKYYWLSVFFIAFSCYGKQPPELVYTANAGVMLKTDKGNIFIDSIFKLHKNWGGFRYSHLSEQQQHEIINGIGDFSEVRLVLATHIHRDHFHPELVGHVLKNNPTARLFANQQITESVLEGFVNSNPIRDQLIQYSPQRTSWQDEDIQVTIFPVPHGGSRHQWIDNSLIMLEVNGHKFLHLGDAVVDNQSFAKYNFPEQKIDTLITPHWFLTGKGKQIINHHIKPERIIALHLPPDKTRQNKIKKAVQNLYPNLTIMVKNMALIEQ